MKKSISLLVAALVCAAPAFAQMGGNFDSSMNQLFDKNPVFSATMQTTMSGPGGSITSSSKIYYDHGNSRYEMDAANVHGSTPPDGLAKAQALGMDKVISIAPSRGTNVYMIYPNLRAYILTPASPNSTQKSQIQITKLGADTVAGHPCVKNQWTLPGQPPLTVWNATDLNNFPIQITISDQGSTATMNFVNISFKNIAASQFYPPASYKHYSTLQELLQAAIISRIGGGTPAASRTAPAH